MKAYYQRPEVKAYKKAYQQRPEYKAYMKAYYQKQRDAIFKEEIDRIHIAKKEKP